jgi:hypothetical protein
VLLNAELPPSCDDQGNLSARQHSKADPSGTVDPQAGRNSPEIRVQRLWDPPKKRLRVYNYNENRDYTPPNQPGPVDNSTLDQSVRSEFPMPRNNEFDAADQRNPLGPQGAEQRDRNPCLPTPTASPPKAGRLVWAVKDCRPRSLRGRLLQAASACRFSRTANPASPKPAVRFGESRDIAELGAQREGQHHREWAAAPGRLQPTMRRLQENYPIGQVLPQELLEVVRFPGDCQRGRDARD